MLIDVHAHALSQEFLTSMGVNKDENGEFVFPGYGLIDKLLYDLDARLENLKARGVDLQIIAPPPNLLSDIETAPDVEFSQLLNSHTAKLIDESNGLLAGLAVAPLGVPVNAVDELKRAINDYGFVGLALPTTVMGKPLDAPVFSALFEYLNAEKIPAFLHPTTAIHRDNLGSYTMNTIVGCPHETTLAVSRIIFSGICERYPDLRIILAHGGGNICGLAGRIDRGYTAPKYEANQECRRYISRPPSEYLHRFFFDTCVLNQKALLFLIENVGVDNVVFGSDFPFEIGDSEGKIALTALKNFSKDDSEKILSSNAAAVFNLT